MLEEGNAKSNAELTKRRYYSVDATGKQHRAYGRCPEKIAKRKRYPTKVKEYPVLDMAELKEMDKSHEHQTIQT